MLLPVSGPQQLITSQTLERSRFASPGYWHGRSRLRPPTGRGTEEEFNWALDSYRKTGFPEIKWFFRKVDEFKAPSDPARIVEALEQWEKVLAFRERLNKGTPPLFYKEFLTLPTSGRCYARIFLCGLAHQNTLG